MWQISNSICNFTTVNRWNQFPCEYCSSGSLQFMLNGAYKRYIDWAFIYKVIPTETLYKKIIYNCNISKPSLLRKWEFILLLRNRNATRHIKNKIQILIQDHAVSCVNIIFFPRKIIFQSTLRTKFVLIFAFIETCLRGHVRMRPCVSLYE